MAIGGESKCELYGDKEARRTAWNVEAGAGRVRCGKEGGFVAETEVNSP